MQNKKSIRSKNDYDAARELEKSGLFDDAIKRYRKAANNDPTNVAAWNRMMLLYRKAKTKAAEANLIKSAIAAYQKSVESEQLDWLNANSSKVKDSRELAKTLGLLQPDGLPIATDPVLERWQTRLHLIIYRIGTARKKKYSSAGKSRTKKNPTSAVP